ncbi:C39 family peptidase [Mesorhizobium sp. UC22_110]|uniref:C39 family peptidase n=1 Tax=unclassified Mesorhizobium TaxID=325217 RepID=UPI0036708841
MPELMKHRNDGVRRLPDENSSTRRRPGTSIPMAGIASLFLGWAFTLCLPVPDAISADANTKMSTNAAKSYRKTNDIPPRHQWEANYGYCGEVSLISAGLYYGQYVSQYDARAIASRNTDQSKESSQLLLGVNDSYAAAQMHLKATQWKGAANPESFLSWVKEKVASGYPVVIGVYYNQRSFEASNDPDAGDNEYDHIVPVIGVSSKHPFMPSAYHGDDVITFSDNGLWSPDGEPDFIYKSSFESFQANRRQANSNLHPIYSLPRDARNYGVAITGIIDRDGQALPVRLSTNVNHEKPIMKEGANDRPASQDLTLTVTVSGLTPGVSYNLYRYDDFRSVPDAGFNAAAEKAEKKWAINIKSGSSFSATEKIKSDQTVVYRAVPATAP